MPPQSYPSSVKLEGRESYLLLPFVHRRLESRPTTDDFARPELSSFTERESSARRVKSTKTQNGRSLLRPPIAGRGRKSYLRRPAGQERKSCAPSTCFKGWFENARHPAVDLRPPGQVFKLCKVERRGVKLSSFSQASLFPSLTKASCK